MEIPVVHFLKFLDFVSGGPNKRDLKDIIDPIVRELRDRLPVQKLATEIEQTPIEKQTYVNNKSSWEIYSALVKLFQDETNKIYFEKIKNEKDLQELIAFFKEKGRVIQQEQEQKLRELFLDSERQALDRIALERELAIRYFMGLLDGKIRDLRRERDNILQGYVDRVMDDVEVNSTFGMLPKQVSRKFLIEYINGSVKIEGEYQDELKNAKTLLDVKIAKINRSRKYSALRLRIVQAIMKWLRKSDPEVEKDLDKKLIDISESEENKNVIREICKIDEEIQNHKNKKVNLNNKLDQEEQNKLDDLECLLEMDSNNDNLSQSYQNNKSSPLI